MFRRPVVLMLLLVPALLGAGSWYYWTRPFEPLRATPRELCGWLLCNDAAAAPAPLQADLFERCRMELLDTTSALDWSELSEALKSVDHEQRSLWERNMSWWGRVWWLREARAYMAIPREQRTQYLNEKLAHWSKHEWVALDKLRTISDEQPLATATPAKLAALNSEIESWIAAATPDERPALQEFWAALQWQFLLQPKLWKNLGT